MKIRLRLLMSCFVITVSLSLLYASKFSLGMDVADYGWSYSYYHFQTMWKHCLLILFITMGLILMVSTKDYFEGIQRKIFVIGLISISGVHLMVLSNLFFSLNLLMQNGYSTYQSLSQSSLAFIISSFLILAYLGSIVLLMFHVGQKSD